MKKVKLIIRIALSLCMAYGVYTETGLMTGCFAFTVIIFHELDIQINKLRRYLIDEQNKYIKELEEHIKKQ